MRARARVYLFVDSDLHRFLVEQVDIMSCQSILFFSSVQRFIGAAFILLYSVSLFNFKEI